ncbi:MAG: thiamine-phosphate kinase [Thermoplasmata archaeon]
MPAKLEDLGEREIIRRIKDLLGETEWGIGLGDDAAAIPFDESYLLITTDLIVRKTHVPESMTPFQTGWYLAAINLSDIAAMGGKPLGLLVALGLPRRMDFHDLQQCVLGMKKCCAEYGAEILGGDTKESEELTLSGSAIGTVPKDQILLRKGSRPGDDLCVTGTLGRAACGYFALKRGVQLKDAVSALLMPRPRIEEGMALSSSRAVTACMDISDGLATSLHQMSELGGFHFSITFEDIPKPNELSAFADIPPEELVLYFGGDFELVFTVRKDCLKEAQQALERVGSRLWRIGEVTESDEIVLVKAGEERPLENRGWEHLSPANLKSFKY